MDITVLKQLIKSGKLRIVAANLGIGDDVCIQVHEAIEINGNIVLYSNDMICFPDSVKETATVKIMT